MAQITRDSLEKDIRSLVSSVVEVDEKKITSDAKFVEDLGMDSMMALEILASLEKKYKIKIPEEFLTRVTDLKSVIEIIKDIIDKDK